MKRTVSNIFPPETKVFFRSGNYAGKEAKVISVEENSKDSRAIFGFLIHVEFEDGTFGVAEKSEHIQKI